MASIEDADIPSITNNEKSTNTEHPSSSTPSPVSSILATTAADERETPPIPENKRSADTQQSSSATPSLGSLILPMNGNVNATIQPILSDHERLMNTLQEYFTNFLKEQKEQSESLCQAIEQLKPKPPPTADKKTAFWNTYKTLADEHDKELLQRYSTDLDTSLIFAGLFSAVDSAFIIQIQPEFQLSDPSQSFDLPIITLVAQSLLYISLGSTLLAALLAVLGKQWLMYYSAAGERGTIETRGLERQRKLDGLQKWKFDTIMQAFPLLLQFALFLFAAALSVYLRKIHHVLALIALGLTSIGTVAYILLLISAMFFQDSPFQTPLAYFVVHLFPRSWRIKSKAVLEQSFKQIKTVIGHIPATFSAYTHRSKNILPHFMIKQQTNSLKPEKPTQLFNTSDLIPSPEVSAVSWVLESSTDPVMLSRAADVAIELQWPSDMDVESQLNRLWENFLACFEYHRSYDDDHEPSRSDVVCMDKSKFQRQILEQLLMALLSKLKANQISMDFAGRIIWTTHQLAKRSKDNEVWNFNEDDRLSMIYRFCGQLPQSGGWVQVVLATGLLAEEWYFRSKKPSEHQVSTSWVYEALKRISVEDNVKWDSETEAGVAGLLLALYYCDTPPLKEHVQAILQVLLTTGKSPRKESTLTRNAGLLLLKTNLENWFQDPDLEPILQEASVWARLITQWIPQAGDYDIDHKGILLGHMLSKLPSWQPYLQQHLCSWITLFFQSKWDLAEKYNSVLMKIWQPATGGYTFTDSDEEALGLTYAALSQGWQEFDFSSSEALAKVTSWLRCSSRVLLRETFYAKQARARVVQHLGALKATELTNTFLLPLRSSLLQAAAAARHKITQSSHDPLAIGTIRKDSSKIWEEALGHVGKILDDLAAKMPIPTDPEKDEDYWEDLHIQFYKEIQMMEEMLGKLTLSKDSAGGSVNVG
ncbi:hypothetical protein B0H14DRAFT_2596529 [Mycena olivaceomarginata]|nr:hypothetical protein B0H14DRAFT_2596529 [Mycena olivaceomarginata]